MNLSPTQYSEYLARQTRQKPSTGVPVTPMKGPVLAHKFVVPGNPMGKPRMTQRDVWAKRDVVVRYRAYADAIRAACGPVPENPVGVNVIAYIAMPASWSEKKKASLDGLGQRQKPDYDNISKSIGDALFSDDSVLFAATCVKFWCREGHQRTAVSVLYLGDAAKPTP